MNNKEIKAARKLLFLDVKEAADNVGGVSVRTWQNWESGKYQVPADVSEALQDLFDRRLEMIEVSEDVICESAADQVEISYYMKYEEYLADHKGASVIDWRLSQSVAAYLFGEGLATIT